MDSGNQQQQYHLGLVRNADSWASPYPWNECLHSNEILGDPSDNHCSGFSKRHWAAQEVVRVGSGATGCRRDEAVKASRSPGLGAGPSTKEMVKQAGPPGSKKEC